VSRRDADHPGPVQQENLADSADRYQVRRAIASAAGLRQPALVAGGAIVGDEPAARGGDNQVVNYQWGTREAPARELRPGAGGSIARAPDCTVGRVQRGQDAGRTEGVHAAVGEGRGRTRAGPGVRLPEPGCIPVLPDRPAGGQVVAGDNLIVTA